MHRALAYGIISGAYWLHAPTPMCEVVIASQGVVASKAIAATAHIGGYRRNVAVLAITSTDRLNPG